MRPNNSFKPSPHQSGAEVHAFGYIRNQSLPAMRRLNSGLRQIYEH